MLLMDESRSDSLRTRVSLLERVKDLDDARSWEEFFRTYERLVRGLARRRGLREHEAEEVAQEVFKRIAQTIHRFERVPRPGAFRKWLGKLTRWRADDKLRERARQPFESWQSPDESTPTAERVPAPPDPQMEFEQETRQHLLETLFKRLEPRIPPKHLQVFHLLVIENVPVERVMELYNMSASHVYVIKHRVTQKMREEVRNLPLDWD
jgi:RNA polymerase sigma-70 factor (ECF subfamily)